MNYFEFAYVNITHGFIYLFANYFIASGASVAMGDFSVKPRGKCALIIISEMLVCVALMELLAALYFTLFHSDTFVPFVCGLIVTVAYALVRCKNKPAVRIMRASVYIGISSLALTLTMSMGSLLGVPGYYLQWILISLNGIIIYSGAFLVRLFSVKDEMHCPASLVVTLAVMGAVCYTFVILRRTYLFDPALCIALCIIFIFIYILAYYIICQAVKKSYEDAYERANALMRSADRVAFRLSNENLENLHRMRHELKNHYAVMKTFLDSGDYEKLKSYFAEYSDIIENTVGFADCGNATLNAIIGIEQGRVSGAGAKLDYRIAVPEKLNVNDADLCSLVMNFINNAVEYYERAGRVGDNVISLEVRLAHGALLVTVANDIKPEDGERALSLETSKKNKSMHGYGSKIVAGIVNKYNGSVSYEVKEGKFTACAMLFSE